MSQNYTSTELLIGEYVVEMYTTSFWIRYYLNFDYKQGGNCKSCFDLGLEYNSKLEGERVWSGIYRIEENDH